MGKCILEAVFVKRKTRKSGFFGESRILLELPIKLDFLVCIGSVANGLRRAGGMESLSVVRMKPVTLSSMS